MTFQPPKPLGDENKHYWLVQSMAQAAGVDLAAEAAAGHLPQDKWADMVTRCRGCSWERDGGCSRWMALQVADEPITVPSKCENVETFDTLQAALG
jgi:hypothetical protein